MDREKDRDDLPRESEENKEFENRNVYGGDVWTENENEEDEEEDELSPPPDRKWIRNTIAWLLAAALVVNVFAFWPQIYNSVTIPFLNKSKELSAEERIQSYKEAVVLVSTDKGKGTGFHVSGGYIVTNYHVIEDGAYTAVKFPGNDQAYEAATAGADPDLDVAVLKVDLGDRELPSIEIERERPWEPGAPVYVIGNPLYFTQIAAEGRIIGTMPIRGREQPALALDAPVFKGNSGSPVINERGKAIAVVYATTEIRQDGRNVEAGLAVPLDGLSQPLRDLLQVDEN